MGLFRNWLEGRMPWGASSEIDPDLTVGAEVEFLVPEDLILFNGLTAWRTLEEGPGYKEFLEELSVTLGLKVVLDLTVELEGERGYIGGLEANSSTYRASARSELYQEMGALENVKARLNRNCGIHVHVGTFEEIARLPLSFLLNIVSLVDEPGIYRALPNRKASVFARQFRREVASVLRDPHQPFTEESLRELLITGRDYAINIASALRQHGTIEFRYFGADGPFKVSNHLVRPVEYVLSLISRAKSEPYKVGGLTVDGNDISLSPALQARVREEKKAPEGVGEKEFSFDKLYGSGKLGEVLSLMKRSPFYREKWAPAMIMTLYTGGSRGYAPVRQYLQEIVEVLLRSRFDYEEPIGTLSQLTRFGIEKSKIVEAVKKALMGLSDGYIGKLKDILSGYYQSEADVRNDFEMDILKLLNIFGDESKKPDQRGNLFAP